MTTLQDMEMYNVIESSFLEQYIIDGAMQIHFEDGNTAYRKHPMYGEYIELPEHSNEEFETLIDKVKETNAKVEVDEIEGIWTYTSKYICMTVKRTFIGNLIIDIGTVHNVWEIERDRFASNEVTLTERANEIYNRLRGREETVL